jgi:hypothetical protein
MLIPSHTRNSFLAKKHAAVAYRFARAAREELHPLPVCPPGVPCRDRLARGATGVAGLAQRPQVPWIEAEGIIPPRKRSEVMHLLSRTDHARLQTILTQWMFADVRSPRTQPGLIVPAFFPSPTLSIRLPSASLLATYATPAIPYQSSASRP